MVSPAADIEVDERLVRALLEEQHADLAPLPLRALDAGWDNTLWRVGDDLMARLARRAVAAELTVNEQRWLPVLAPVLPLPVPAPVRIGLPSDAYRTRRSARHRVVRTEMRFALDFKFS